MTKATYFSRVRFILCEPSHPGNIGAAARAIKTMGFTDLRVVNPRESDYKNQEEAIAFATSSVDVLNASQSYNSLSEALEGVTFAWALSGYDREFGPVLMSLREASQKTSQMLSTPETQEGDIAFIFGCERSGLTNEEVLMCQGCAAIPANPESPSLNLAQAVQLTAYEMQMSLMAIEKQDALYQWQGRFEHEGAADLVAVEGFLAHWEKAMIALGVHSRETPKNFMAITRRLFSRAGLTRTEIDLLRGICSVIIKPKAERASQKEKKQG